MNNLVVYPVYAVKCPIGSTGFHQEFGVVEVLGVEGHYRVIVGFNIVSEEPDSESAWMRGEGTQLEWFEACVHVTELTELLCGDSKKPSSPPHSVSDCGLDLEDCIDFLPNWSANQSVFINSTWLEF